MNNWFTVKVKYTKQLDNGAFKRVTEPYLLAAMTFTDAEARIYEELANSIRGEFNVTGIARTEIHDIFAYDDGEWWYKVKVKYDNMDGNSDKPKKVTQNFLIEANSVKQAYERLQECLKDLMADYEIPSITVSPIVDIFPYSENLDREISRTPVEEVAEEEETPENGGAVFSASGSDVDEDEEMETEVEDEYSEE